MKTDVGTGIEFHQARELPEASFVLSLVAGVLVLFGSGMMLTFSQGAPYGFMMGGYYGMMNGYYGMMQGFGAAGWFYGAAMTSMIAGAGILIGAFTIYSRPDRALVGGILVLALSVLSLLGMGGFLIGATLGIVGGVMAIAWRPSRESAAG